MGLRQFILQLCSMVLISGLSQFALASECEMGKVVAIIDTGMDIDHPLFQNRLWKNPGETGLDANGISKENNQIDDDNNGYIDDVHGWNFVEDNSNLRDNSGHGTHIAGLIINQGGIASPQLMTLKYFDPKHSDRAAQSEFLSAIQYAISMGAQIINISGGGYRPQSKELELLKMAKDRGITVVAASGNTSSDSKAPTKLPFFPAAYALPNIISVVATDQAGNILPTSNIPPTKESIFLPGHKLESALPNGKFGMMTGSSMAAASYTGNMLAENAAACVDKSQQN